MHFLYLLVSTRLKWKIVKLTFSRLGRINLFSRYVIKELNHFVTSQSGISQDLILGNPGSWWIFQCPHLKLTLSYQFTIINMLMFICYQQSVTICKVMSHENLQLQIISNGLLVLLSDKTRGSGDELGNIFHITYGIYLYLGITFKTIGTYIVTTYLSPASLTISHLQI